MACISFDELVPNSSVTIYSNQHVDAVELIIVSSGKTRARALQQIKEIPSDIFEKQKFSEVKLPGKGAAKTYTVHFKDAVELIMVLPGKICKQHRKKMADIVVRYLDGDMSMCHEIKDNQTMGKAKSYLKFANSIMNQVENEEKVSPVGYVYATSSSAFPGLLKIGRAIDVPRRVAQLNTCCAPAPHIVVAVAPSIDYSRDETAAHRHFAKQRREGEFFQVSGDEVKEYFQSISAKFQSEMTQNMTSMVGQTFLTDSKFQIQMGSVFLSGN
jgi:hypothetical protein